MSTSLRYTVILQKEDDGGYVVTVPILPGCVSHGDTRAEALRNIGEAIELYVEDMRAAGESVPIEDERTYVEVNALVRCTKLPTDLSGQELFRILLRLG